MHELGVQIGEKVAKSEALGKSCVKYYCMLWDILQYGGEISLPSMQTLACVFESETVTCCDGFSFYVSLKLGPIIVDY